ncbi:GntR family transcriptional regulator [Flindersiella endophytica]
MSPDRDDAVPLYHRIREELRAAIERREYAPSTPFITQRELCDRYGVSSTTAIRALNDLVAEGILVRRRGQGTFVAEQPEPGAAPPHRVRTEGATIGCLVHGLEGPHGTRVVSGVETMCAELGYRMLLVDSYGSAEREAKALEEFARAGVAGVVAYPAQGRVNTAAYSELNARIPLVLTDRYLPELATDVVMPDHFAVGYQVTTHLIALGHTRIATLWSETDCTSVQDRLTGHKQALREHSLPVRPELTVVRRFWSQADGTDQSVLRDLLDGPEPPSVLLCANGFVLAAAAYDLVRLGVEFPDRIELAGMDNAGPLEPLPITTVAAVLPSKEMGREAMRLLASRIASGERHPQQHVVLPISLSTRAAAVGYLRAVVGGQHQEAVPLWRQRL